MVYDKQDRLIFTQDASLASSANQFGAKGWLFTKYDQFSRVVYTGFVASNDDRATVQAIVTNSTTIISNNESRSSSSGNYSGLDLYYTNSAFPSVITKLLSVNYYDTYPDETPFPDQNKILNQPILEETYDTLGRSTKSLPLASFVKNINDDSWTKNYSFYDGKGRSIGSTSINHLGGSTVVGSKLDFAGIVKQTQTLHNRIASEIPVNIIEDFTYDHQNRLLKHYHEVVGKTPKELLADNTYDDLGRLVSKKVGAVSDATFAEVSLALQTIKYDYNIRGWMTGINLNPTGGLDTGKLFSYKIKYNDPVNTAIKKYNGNIAEIDWIYQDEDAKRYEYTYDDLNRLRKGNYKSPGQTTTTDSKFYNEELTYDVNGNIKTLIRNAKPQVSTQAAVQVDDLTYVYENTNKSNRLSTVYDNAQNSNGYPAVTVPQPMTYDFNGNMLTMPDKGITDPIVYNYLNLPQTIIQGGNPINYTYRADGVKLHKKLTVGGQDIDTDYLDGFVYTTPYSEDLDGALLDNPDVAHAGQRESFELAEKTVVGPGGPINLTEASPNFFPTAEGFYDYENFKYIYQYKDHLGNVRLSFDRSPDDGSAEVVSSNDYYPFGLNFINIQARTSHPPVYNPSVSFENYKYNGKELQETGMYAMDFRHYMPDIGRFIGMDRLSDIMPDWTPYRFSFNNPVYFSDPTGLLEEGRCFATCPTCPNTPKFEPFINDPSNTYVYDPKTDTAEKETQIQEVVVTGKKSESNTNYHDWSQTLRKSSGYAFSANKILFQPAFERASQYGIPKIYTTTTLTYEKALPKILGGRRIIYQPLMTMNALKAGRIAKGLKITGRVLGGAGLALGVYDMTQNGITTSNSLDVTMSALALTPTGVTQGIAATYFLLNGVTTLVTGKDIGQHMDENGYNLGELINDQIK